MAKRKNELNRIIDEIPIADIPANAIINDFLKDDEYVSGYTQWSIQGDRFYSTYPTIKALPAGFYELAFDHSTQQYYFKKRNIITEEILVLPDENLSTIINDISKFWKSKELYKKYDYVYKRGILLYGPPGCGKTSLINLLSKKLVDEYDGIVINISEPDHIYDFTKAIGPLREIEPDRKIIVIFEDIDNFVKERSLLTKLLNILDGDGKIDNVVNLATTNYPEELEERISNRPSRFDRRYEITLPDYKVREFYIKKKMHKEDISKIDLKLWLKSTEGFTLDHLKELILSYIVLEYTFDEALKEMKNMIKNGILKPIKKIANTDDGPIGYSYGKNGNS